MDPRPDHLGSQLIHFRLRSPLINGTPAACISSSIQLDVKATYQIKPKLPSKTMASFTYEPDEDVFSDRNTKIVSDSLLHCIMDKEIFRNGNKADLLKLKHKVVISKLDSAIKTDFMEYLAAANTDDELVSLRKLIYDFLNAKTAIENTAKSSDLSDWVASVLDGLQPSIKGYSKEQINLALLLLIHEQTLRDPSYDELFGRFVEIDQDKGGVY